MIAITKATLRRLNAAAGSLDTDSGQVFVGFVGRLYMQDRLYHGDLQFAPAGDTRPAQTVSIEALLTDEV